MATREGFESGLAFGRPRTEDGEYAEDDDETNDDKEKRTMHSTTEIPSLLTDTAGVMKLTTRGAEVMRMHGIDAKISERAIANMNLMRARRRRELEGTEEIAPIALSGGPIDGDVTTLTASERAAVQARGISIEVAQRAKENIAFMRKRGL